MNTQRGLQGNILIVDDVPDNLELLSRILTKRGCEVRSVERGAMAVEIAQTGWAELILLDINMPEMDGFQVCQKLKAHPRTSSIPVIFLSASDRVLYKINAFALGGVDYITKPFQIKEVVARVKTHLQLRNLHKTLAEEVEKRTAELTKALNKANAANHAKSLFFSQMTHELRTPMNAILGFTQIMQRDKSLNPEQYEQLRIINQSGEHLLALINDVLEMSKIEAGCSTLEKSDFDLYQLLNGIAEMLKPKAKAKGLKFSVEKTTNLPQYVTTDQQKLRQVLINLLANAVKYTEEGRVTLRVANLEDQTKSNTKLLFEVEDTGQGIAVHELDTLFQPFIQTKTGKKSQSGTGLGLSISRQYVELMQGNIGVSSIEGKGTIFNFDIEVNLAKPVDLDKEPPKRVIGLISNQFKYRILVVEDKWENRYLLVKLLISVGFEVRYAVNGKECLEIWESWSPHLIFMDMQMPVMDGYEATRRIKANIQPNQSVIIIALTATAIKQHREKMLSVGCDDFMSIPLTQNLLWEKIAKHLNVQYVYEESVLSSNLEPESVKFSLTPASLKLMPTEWITQLHYFATAADSEQISQLLNQIPPENTSLAEALQDLVDNFCFEQIVDLANKSLN